MINSLSNIYYRDKYPFLTTGFIQYSNQNCILQDLVWTHCGNVFINSRTKTENANNLIIISAELHYYTVRCLDCVMNQQFACAPNQESGSVRVADQQRSVTSLMCTQFESTLLWRYLLHVRFILMCICSLFYFGMCFSIISTGLGSEPKWVVQPESLQRRLAQWQRTGGQSWSCKWRSFFTSTTCVRCPYVHAVD